MSYHPRALLHPNTNPTTLDEFGQTAFSSVYLKAPKPSLLKKWQGKFLRLYLYFTHGNPPWQQDDVVYNKAESINI